MAFVCAAITPPTPHTKARALFAGLAGHTHRALSESSRSLSVPQKHRLTGQQTTRLEELTDQDNQRIKVFYVNKNASAPEENRISNAGNVMQVSLLGNGPKKIGKKP